MTRYRSPSKWCRNGCGRWAQSYGLCKGCARAEGLSGPDQRGRMRSPRNFKALIPVHPVVPSRTIIVDGTAFEIVWDGSHV